LDQKGTLEHFELNRLAHADATASAFRRLAGPDWGGSSPLVRPLEGSCPVCARLLSSLDGQNRSSVGADIPIAAVVPRARCVPVVNSKGIRDDDTKVVGDVEAISNYDVSLKSLLQGPNFSRMARCDAR